MKGASLVAAAKTELREATHYYEARAVGLGRAFLEEVRGALEQLTANPESAPVVQGTIRRKAIRRFPYSLLYALEVDGIRVYAVMHQKRSPGYWVGRR